MTRACAPLPIFALLFGGCLLWASPAPRRVSAASGAAEPDLARPTKQVFAHYMVCCPAAGGGATVEDYAREIREAQARGIDGFALNCGGWSPKE